MNKNLVRNIGLTVIAVVGIGIVSAGLYTLSKNSESHRNKDFLYDVVHSLIDIHDNRDVNSFSKNNTDRSQQIVASAYYNKDKMERAVERMNNWVNNPNTTIQNTTKATISALQLWKEANELIINLNVNDQNQLAQFQVKIKEANDTALTIGMEAVGGKSNNPLYLNNVDKQKVISYIKNTLGDAMKNEGKTNILPELFSAGVVELSLEGKLPVQ